MTKTPLLPFCILLCLLSLHLPVSAQLTPLVDSIPMSDGKKLAADIYIPSGMSTGPVILIQTPYNRQLYRNSLPLQTGLNLNASNYIFVITDWRGFYGSSAAAYSGSPDMGRDGYSTVEWIAAQSWSNGKIGTWGPSALGRVQYQTAKKNPPHLTCICPLVAGPQYNYNEYFPGGDLRTEYVQQLGGLGFGITPTLMANPVRNLTWAYIENQNFYPDSIKVPCLMIGGWYDHTPEQMLPFFNAIRAQSPVSIRDKHRLLMGPWVHGGHGAAYVGSSTQGQLSYPNAANKSDTMARKFFDYHLRNISNGWNTSAYVQYYQMGDNTWQASSTWPPTGMTPVTFYFHQNGKLDNTMPSNNTDQLSFSYDPTDPSPTIGGPTLRADLNQGPYDQAPSVESRNDLLIFTTDALPQNVVMKGNPVLNMQVSSNKYDTDFDVRLTDVYPDGRSMLVGDGTLRMRFRNGLNTSDTARMVPGTIYTCSITIPNSAITFLAGHKIRVDISSSNYPRFNRNMNNGGAMYPGNSLDAVSNPQTASNTVYVNNVKTSFITLPLQGYSVGISEQEQVHAQDVIMYPNPANDRVHIQGKEHTVYRLNVYNLVGDKLEERTFDNNTSIDLGIYNTGVYLIELSEQGSQQLIRKKLVKL